MSSLSWIDGVKKQKNFVLFSFVEHDWWRKERIQIGYAQSILLRLLIDQIVAKRTFSLLDAFEWSSRWSLIDNDRVIWLIDLIFIGRVERREREKRKTRGRPFFFVFFFAVGDEVFPLLTTRQQLILFFFFFFIAIGSPKDGEKQSDGWLQNAGQTVSILFTSENTSNVFVSSLSSSTCQSWRIDFQSKENPPVIQTKDVFFFQSFQGSQGRAYLFNSV